MRTNSHFMSVHFTHLFAWEFASYSETNNISVYNVLLWMCNWICHPDADGLRSTSLCDGSTGRGSFQNDECYVWIDGIKTGGKPFNVDHVNRSICLLSTFGLFRGRIYHVIWAYNKCRSISWAYLSCLLLPYILAWRRERRDKWKFRMRVGRRGCERGGEWVMGRWALSWEHADGVFWGWLLPD